jgi:ubiquitin carboxyl-terminal hydrolase L5
VVEDKGLFFAAQTIQNACGTQAILSVILNNDRADSPSHATEDKNDAAIDIGPELRKFKDFTTGIPPDIRGEALSNSSLIRTTHNSFARSSPFADETHREATGTEDIFHFIGYITHHGTLYELDGLQPYPISHGPCTSETFPEKIIPVLQRRIERYPAGEVRFNLMAVCRDLRIRAEEIGDVEALAREKRKRTQWEWENALRRHNFVGFTGEILKGVVRQKLRNGEYEGWVKDAKEATEKRLKEKKTSAEHVGE